MTDYLIRKGSQHSDALSKAENTIPRHPEELQKWQEQQIHGHSRRAANTGILCLTPICNNPIMWTHYAMKHTGICVMFRVRNIREESHLDFIAEAQPIEYADRCPLINFVQDDRFDIVRKAFLTKATTYCHEAEWRIVRYDDGPGLKPLPKGIIGAVILGVQIESPNRDRVIQACADYDGRVRVVQASLEPQSYGLRVDLLKTV